jgi:hypothetical protein
MIRWAFLAPLLVVDPRRCDGRRECSVGGDDVKSHAKVAGVANPMVPPCEPALMRSPVRRIDVDYTGLQHARPRGPFERRHVRQTDERFGMEDVAVRGRDVDIPGNDHVSLIHPFGEALSEGVEEGELVVVMPMPDLAAMRHVEAHDLNRYMAVDDAADQAGLPIEVLVAERARCDDISAALRRFDRASRWAAVTIAGHS